MHIVVKAVVAAAFAVTAFTGAQAVVTVHTSQASFNAALTRAGTDTFNNLAETAYGTSLTRGAGEFGYTVSAPNGLFPGSAGGNPFMSTNTATDALLFGNFTGGATAIGGFFFGSDINGDPASVRSITVTLTTLSGSISRTLEAPTTGTFLGFTTHEGIVSLRVASLSGEGGFRWPSVDNLTMGVVPEPATWAMMILGFGLVGVALRRQRALATA